MVSSQAIEQPLWVAILGGDGPVSTLETGKGIDSVGILRNPAKDTHRVRDFPAVSPPLPPWKAESLLGGERDSVTK